MNVPKLGDIVAGRYELTAELGRGGFGIVFKATQIGMNRPVALKVLLPQAASEESMIERFVREAQLAKNLVHPNTIQLFDFGETESGCLYIAMEYLEGETLDRLIKREGQLPMERAVHIAAQILKSLAEAHEHGIVHRDLKPANIFMRELVGEKDFVKVLDFGIAKALNLDGAEEEQQLTKTGSSFGTPSYMAPEQIRGVNIGPHTDLYALGLILIKMLTGATAIEGGTPIETAALQLSNSPVPMPDAILHSPLGPILQRALAKKVEERYRQAADMLHDLQAISASARSGVLPTIAPGQSGMLLHASPGQPSGQLIYSGQFDYHQLSGPVPMPGGHAPQKRSALVPLLIVVILVLLVGGAAGVYFFVIKGPSESGQAEAAQASSGDGGTTAATGTPATDMAATGTTAATGATAATARPAGEDLGALTAEIEAAANETDAGTAEPAEVAQVEVAIASEPAGAVVKEGDQLLGTTPFTARFAEGSGSHTLTISGFGYEDHEVVVDTAKPAPVSVALVKKDDGTTAAAAATTDTAGDSGSKAPAETTSGQTDAATTTADSSSSRRRRDREKSDSTRESTTTKKDSGTTTTKKDSGTTTTKKDDGKKDDGASKTKPSIPLPD